MEILLLHCVARVRAYSGVLCFPEKLHVSASCIYVWDTSGLEGRRTSAIYEKGAAEQFFLAMVWAGEACRTAACRRPIGSCNTVGSKIAVNV